MKRYVSLALLAGVAVVTPAFALDPINLVSADSPNGYKLVLVLHELLLVFWLGPDLGRYIWSTRAANPALSPQTRITAGELVHKIELFPKVCISLMLTVGGILTEAFGIEHPWWQMAGIILLGPVWLSMVLISAIKPASKAGQLIISTDTWFRLFMAGAVLASVSYSWSIGRLDDTPWVTGKLLLFAAILLFGLMVKVRLKPFEAGLATLSASGPTEQTDAAMARAVASARPYVFGIWIALAMAAWLGVAQPG